MKDYVVTASNTTNTSPEIKFTGHVIFDEFVQNNHVYNMVGTRSKSPRFVGWTLWKEVDDYWW